ncbi:MAG: sensor domain-containing diguanylate cyclase [Burkholderiales bacterium]
MIPAKPKLPFRGLYLAAVTVWLLLTLIAYGFVISQSIEGVRSSFARHTESVIAELRDKLKANETVLAGFSSFLSAVEANDRVSVQRYASMMLDTYPHIYMLEVAREVGDAERLEFERYLRKHWGRPFDIRSFSYDGSRSWTIAPDKPVYQPIVLIWPETPEARPVVGLDMDSVPHLREALLEARVRRASVSSNPFKLVEGDDGYVMFRHTERSGSRLSNRPEYGFAGALTAILVMRADDLLPSVPTPLTAYRLDVTRTGRPVEPLLYDVPAAIGPNRLEAVIFPLLRLESRDFSTPQPMQLVVERQVRFGDLSRSGIAAVTGVSLLFLILLAAYLRGHHRNILYALALKAQTEYLALHDSLTSLPNRYLLEDRVGQALANWRRHGVGFALLFLDLDRFKEINDTYGHATGDELLCALAGRLKEVIRESDTVARYGGDEFIMLIPGVVNDDDIATVTTKVMGTVARPFELRDATLTLTASLGVSRCPRDGHDFAVLLRYADKAMYIVKHAGRDADSPGAGTRATMPEEKPTET